MTAFIPVTSSKNGTWPTSRAACIIDLRERRPSKRNTDFSPPLGQLSLRDGRTVDTLDELLVYALAGQVIADPRNSVRL